MNLLLKRLTMVNVVFLPLGILASLAGASELSMIMQDFGIDWRVGYPALLVTLALLGLAIWWFVQRWTDRMFRQGSG